MEKEELYRIHIQRRTEAGEWEDIPQIQKETTGFILLQSANEGKGVQSSLVNVSDNDIALFLMHVKTIRNVIIKGYPLFLLADRDRKQARRSARSRYSVSGVQK